MKTKTESVELFGQASSTSKRGTMHVFFPNKNERQGVAVKTLGLWWGLMIIATFIPLAHFVLVPILMVAGLVAAKNKLGLKKMAEKAEGECPNCSERIHIHLEPREIHLPMWKYCPECGKAIEIRFNHPSS